MQEDEVPQCAALEWTKADYEEFLLEDEENYSKDFFMLSQWSKTTGWLMKRF